VGADFPYLDEHTSFDFPPVEEATEEGIVAVGGNLSPGMLLSAYRQGLFPWYSEGDPILWWSPDPRFVLFPAELHLSRSLRKLLHKGVFGVTFDTHFKEVIEACSAIPRPGQRGTWITKEVVAGYCELHRLGYAHSVEVKLDGRLAGGLYGVALGEVFFGESMFSFESNASKVAFAALLERLATQGCSLVDCQVHTPHLARFGAREIPRADFLKLLREGLRRQTPRGIWTNFGA